MRQAQDNQQTRECEESDFLKNLYDHFRKMKHKSTYEQDVKVFKIICFDNQKYRNNQSLFERIDVANDLQDF
jgi:hypothetical protein